MIEKILAYILARCINSEFDQTTVALISENLKISRSQVSVVLNKLVKENVSTHLITPRKFQVL